MIIPQVQAVRTKIPKWVNVKKLVDIAKNINKKHAEKMAVTRVPELEPPGVFLNNMSITKVPNLYEKHVPFSPTSGLLSERVPNTWADKASINKLAYELRKFASKNGVFDATVFYIGLPKRGGTLIDNTQAIKEGEFKLDWKDYNGVKISIVATAKFDAGGNFSPPETFQTSIGQRVAFVKENIEALSEGKVFAKPVVFPPVQELKIRKPDFTRMYKGSSLKKYLGGAVKTKEAKTFSVQSLGNNQIMEGWEVEADTWEEAVDQALVEQGVTVNENDDNAFFSIVNSQMYDPLNSDLTMYETEREAYVAALELMNLQVIEKDESAKEASVKYSPYGVGDKVEYAGENAKITFDNGDGTYTVQPDSGGHPVEDVPGGVMRRIIEDQIYETLNPLEGNARPLARTNGKANKLSFRDEDSLFPFAEDNPKESIAEMTRLEVESDYGTPLKDSNQGWMIPHYPRGLSNEKDVGKIEKDIGTGVSTASVETVIQKKASLSLWKTAQATFYELPIDQMRTRLLDFAKRNRGPLNFNLKDIWAFSKDQIVEIIEDAYKSNFALADKIFGVEKTGKIEDIGPADFRVDDPAYLEFLDRLRESRATNMFGAVPYLMEEFIELDTKRAKAVLLNWMDTFGKRHPDNVE